MSLTPLVVWGVDWEVKDLILLPLHLGTSRQVRRACRQEQGGGPLRGPSFDKWQEPRVETPPSQDDSSEQTESLGSATPGSLNEQSTRPVPPLVEDLGSDMEEDSFHSTGSTLQELTELDSLEIIRRFNELSTMDEGVSLAHPGAPQEASTLGEAPGLAGRPEQLGASFCNRYVN